jgi:exopolysaccharide production protein ExoY
MASEAFGTVVFPRGEIATERQANSQSRHIPDDSRNPAGLVIDGMQDSTSPSAHRSGPTGFSTIAETIAANSNTNKTPRPVGGSLKRILDLIVASVALIAGAPLMLLIALLIKLQDREPIIFAHRRIGFNGKPFLCYKFRTMRTDAERALHDYLASNQEAAAEWEKNRKLRHDPRVTFLGRMLRISSLDELPQLFNVLRGDMSCVGPRPVVADELQRYGASAAEYLRTRPGVTGLWQVSGRNGIDYSERVLLDCYYVRHWSLRYDILILFRTALAVMRFDRAC